MSIIYCPKCGTKLDKGWANCPMCGTLCPTEDDDVENATRIWKVNPEDIQAAESTAAGSDFTVSNEPEPPSYTEEELRQKSQRKDPEEKFGTRPLPVYETRAAGMQAPPPRKKSEQKNKHSKAKERTKGLIVGAAVLAVALTIVLILMKMTSASSGDTSKMPNLIGKTEEEAVSLLKDREVEAFVTYENSDKVDKGKVTAQGVDKGQTLQKGQTVVIVVSSGPSESKDDTEQKYISIPSVVGMTYSAAERLLSGYGLSIVRYSEDYDDTAPAEEILEQSPLTGARVSEGSSVRVKVSLGKKPAEEHSVSASAGKGGSISPKGSSTVKDGESISYAITPDSGYQISSVTVDGQSVGAVSSYKFENVKGTHTIYAEFSLKQTQPTTPDDPDKTDNKGDDNKPDDDEAGGSGSGSGNTTPTTPSGNTPNG